MARPVRRARVGGVWTTSRARAGRRGSMTRRSSPRRWSRRRSALAVTHWSSRLLGRHLGIGDATVARAWRKYRVQPWRRETFKFSTDPQLEAKVRDVVGSVPEPAGEGDRAVRGREVPDPGAEPDRADPAAARGPAGEGDPRLQAQRHHHLVRRAGGRHREGDRPVLRPARQGRVPRLPQDRSPRPTRAGELHVVLDNYHTHKHAEINAWLAKNPRITLHFTPTSGSWLNLVEVFFGIITRQAIRRGSFDSVKELVTAISAFIDGWNDRCHPFTWTKTADEILPHATRKRNSDARH